MKAKKLFAILAAACMLLTLVPTIAASAAAELPAVIEGAPNYADLSTVEGYQNNTAPLPVVDTDAGTIVLGATQNGTSRAEFDLGSLTATDDYVISFSAGSFATWHSTTWGLQVAMTANNGTIGAAQSFIFAGTSKHTFTDEAGTSAASFSLGMNGTKQIDIYVDADPDAGTRTYHVFVGGTWVYTSAAQTAIEPQLAFVGSRGGTNSFTVSNLYVYKVGEEAPRYLPTMPDGNQDLVAMDATVIGGTNITASSFDKTTGALPTVSLTDKQTVLVATPKTAFVGDEYVVSGNILFRNGWNGSIGALTVGTGAVLTADKTASTSGTVYINGTDSGYEADSRTPLVSGDGANFAAHVYPNDAGTADVDFYFENTYVGTVTGIIPSKTLTIGTSKVQWTDSITISNVKMYNVQADPTVTQYTVTVPESVTGGTATGTATVYAGDSVTVTATADAGYTFAGWLQDGGSTYVSTDASYTFVPTANTTLTPVFNALNQYTITVNGSVTGGTAAGSTSVYEGASVTITATAADGYEFLGWLQDDGTTYVSTAASYTFTPAASAVYTPVFGLSLPTQVNATLLDTSSMTLGHSKYAEKAATYNADTDTVTLTASGDGESYATVDLTNFNGADYVVKFTHTGLSYSSSWGIRVSFGSNTANTCLKLNNNANGVQYIAADGTVYSTNTLIYNRGSKEYALYAKADGNGTYTYYIFIAGTNVLTVEGQPAPTQARIDQQGAHSAYGPSFSNFAVYEVGTPKIVAIDVTKTVDNGTASGSTLAVIGNQVTITATPNEGCTFVGWLKNDGTEYVSTDPEYTFAVDGAATYTPVFASSYTFQIGWTNAPYSIDGIAGVDPTEQFTTAKTFEAAAGSTVTVTMHPSESQRPHFKNGNSGWSTLALDNTTYTVENITADWNIIIQCETKPYLDIVIEGEGSVDLEEGYYGIGANRTMNATPAEGWAFSHYSVVIGDGEATEYTDAALALNSMKAGTTYTVTAVFVELPGHSVTVTDAVGGTAAVTGDADENGRYAYGSVVTLKATTEVGYDFAYWIIGTRTYTTKTVYWTVNANVVATPVFRSKTTNEYVVTFYSIDGRLIDTMTSTEIESGASLPSVPYRFGYTNGDWDFEPADGITSDKAVYPTYTKDATTYTVTVVGGTGGKTVEFETRVTVVATATEFTAWVDENGNVLSTDRIYSFLATRDITLTATANTAADYAVAIDPTSLNTSTSDTTFTMSLVAQTMFSDDYRLIECGFVYTTAALDEDTLKIGNDGVKQKVSTKTTEGQFVYTLKNAPKSATITARAYMVIADANGEQITVYSGLCDASWK